MRARLTSGVGGPRARLLISYVAVAAIAVGSVVAAIVIYNRDNSDFHRTQRDEASRAAHQAESVARLSVGELSSTAAFLEAQRNISAREFGVIGRTLLREGGLQTAAFISVVRDDERARYERKHGFEIVEGSLLRLHRAGRRPFYFPLTYVATRAGFHRSPGYDLAVDPERGPSLRRAAASGVATATPPLHLIVGGSGINVVRGVYRIGAPRATPAERRRALVGFTLGSIRVAALDAAAVATVPGDVAVQLRTEGDTIAGPAGALGDAASAPIRIADRTWLLVLRDPNRPDAVLPLLLAGVGLALAALLGSFFFAWSRGERIQELERQASQDALTGLANRRRFEEDLRAAMARSRREGSTGALLMIDLDDFKQVNDTSGHPAGDSLIQEIAAVLRGRTRQSDSLARLGGDEFAVILDRCSREEALIAAEAIAEAVRGHQGPSGAPAVTASIGVAPFGDDPRTGMATVVSEADTAMYAAKDAGRDCVRLFAREAVRGDGAGH